MSFYMFNKKFCCGFVGLVDHSLKSKPDLWRAQPKFFVWQIDVPQLWFSAASSGSP